MRIDINCDMGESFGAYKIGEDEKVIPYITSANIACGCHAGDPMVMAKTMELVKKHRVAVGAHPGYPDLLGFGRRNLETFPGEIKNYLLFQIGALMAFARANELFLQHVKPHGALYNLAARDEKAAQEVIEAVRSFDSELILVMLSGSLGAKMAAASGLKVAQEVFPDRAYLKDGRLAPRTMAGAVIHDPELVKKRIIKLIATGMMTSIEGKEIGLKADTLCIHGDTPGAWKVARVIHKELKKSGITSVPLAKKFE
ncbi:MAG: 5-oxoprolinase subunit PxpA [Pseudomonadota bacterium]